jgi:hypothetical protein
MASIAARTYFPDRSEQLSGLLPAQRAKGALIMLDLIFVATGAAFLYVCVLYAFACDHL